MLRTGAALLIALTAHGADPKATVAGPLFAGGPGTNDPGHIVYRGASLTNLLMTAYKLKGFQLSGPKWMDTARFYIDAKLPSGATKDDLRAMLRNLLAERFGVTVHSAKKELQSYTLLVSKRRAKMKPSPPIAADTDGTAQHLDAGIETDDDGFPVFPAGSPGGLVVMNRAGKMKVGAAQQSLAAICDFLSTQLGAPVDDQTALIGNYDFHLEYAIDGAITLGRGGPVMPPPNPAASGEATKPGELPGSLTSALQEQLGLRLERGRALVDVVVLDHVERTPAAN